MSSETDLDRQRAKIEKHLWDWAERETGYREISGHASTSPTWRMMQNGDPHAGRGAGGCDAWRGRQQRYGHGQYLRIKPARTCYGRETGGLRMPEYTRPELDADRMGPEDTIDRIVRLMLSERLQVVLVAKFFHKRRAIRDIAEFLGLNRNVVAERYATAIDQINLLMYGPAPTRQRMALPDVLPVH